MRPNHFFDLGLTTPLKKIRLSILSLIHTDFPSLHPFPFILSLIYLVVAQRLHPTSLFNYIPFFLHQFPLCYSELRKNKSQVSKEYADLFWKLQLVRSYFLWILSDQTVWWEVCLWSNKHTLLHYTVFPNYHTGWLWLYKFARHQLI